MDKLIMKKTNQQFLDLLNEFIELTLTDLTKLQRIKYETMVTIHVHQVSLISITRQPNVLIVNIASVTYLERHIRRTRSFANQAGE